MSEVIAKEDIPGYKMVPAFVDRTETWRSKLDYAVRLGNSFKGKTHIVIETTSGPKEIVTTVWSLTDNHLQIKGGMMIPLASIIEIHF